MATQALTTKRSERLVGVPACGLGFESIRPEGMPALPTLGTALRGFGRVSDVQYWGKQAHNPVGVTSS